MDDRRGVQWRDPVIDPVVAERFAALERVRRTRKALDAELERTAAARARAGIDEAERRTDDRTDVARLHEIHGSLEHERRSSHRPFAKRNGREIMSFEMAERLVLDRLGYADYADFEANHREEAEPDDVIDLTESSRLAAELAEAEAELARLTVGGHPTLTAALPRRPRPSTGDQAKLAGRTTAARRRVFGTSSGWAPDRRPGGPPPTPTTPGR